jgi:hypothetical protein
MQIDPELLSLYTQEDHGAVIAPEFLDLGHIMESAHVRKPTTIEANVSRGDCPSLPRQILAQEETSINVLRNFVSHVSSYVRLVRNFIVSTKQIQTHSDFGERYRKADLAKSTVIAAIEEDAVFFKSTFDRKSTMHRKSRIHYQSMSYSATIQIYTIADCRSQCSRLIIEVIVGYHIDSTSLAIARRARCSFRITRITEHEPICFSCGYNGK